MPTKYKPEEEDQEPCEACDGVAMYQEAVKPKANGYVRFKIRCLSCSHTVTDERDIHLGCSTWPNCDMYGCGE